MRGQVVCSQVFRDAIALESAQVLARCRQLGERLVVQEPADQDPPGFTFILVLLRCRSQKILDGALSGTVVAQDTSAVARNESERQALAGHLQPLAHAQCAPLEKMDKLPTALLTLALGFLEVREVLDSAHSVCRSWRYAKASWSTLSLVQLKAGRSALLVGACEMSCVRRAIMRSDQISLCERTRTSLCSLSLFCAKYTKVETTLASLARFASLTSLELHGFGAGFVVSSLQGLDRHCLRQLKLRCSIDNDVLLALSALNTLRELELHREWSEAPRLDLRLLRLPCLERLDLHISAESAVHVFAQNLPKLTCLCLHGRQTYMSLSHLARLPCLTELFISDWVFVPALEVPRLTVLTVLRSGVHLASLLTCTHRLVSLSLRGCSRLSSLVGISACTLLETLDLEGCDIDDLGLLSSLPRLRVLNVKSAGVQDLASLRSPSLEELDVSTCMRLNEVDVRGLPGLKKLTAYNMPLETIVGLSGCRELESLSWPLATAPAIEDLTRECTGLQHVSWMEFDNVKCQYLKHTWDRRS